MNKSEALVVLHEICDSLKESVIMDSVSLDDLAKESFANSGSCEIKMRCELDDCSKNKLKPILDGHDLAIKQEDGFVTIYSNPSK
jgi:hypothetical protein